MVARGGFFDPGRCHQSAVVLVDRPPNGDDGVFAMNREGPAHRLREAPVDMTGRRRRIWMVLAALVVLAGTLWAVTRSQTSEPPDSTADSSPRVGSLAPNFSLRRLGEGETTLSELRGEVVVLNLWATWCPPCRAEMPTLQRAFDDYRDQGVEVLAVNTTFQDSADDAAEFMRELGVTLPILLDSTGRVSRSYELRAMPTTHFIDHEGVIREIVLGGPMSEETIRSTLDNLLAERPYIR